MVNTYKQIVDADLNKVIEMSKEYIKTMDNEDYKKLVEAVESLKLTIDLLKDKS